MVKKSKIQVGAVFEVVVDEETSRKGNGRVLVVEKMKVFMQFYKVEPRVEIPPL